MTALSLCCTDFDALEHETSRGNPQKSFQVSSWTNCWPKQRHHEAFLLNGNVSRPKKILQQIRTTKIAEKKVQPTSEACTQAKHVFTLLFPQQKVWSTQQTCNLRLRLQTSFPLYQLRPSSAQTCGPNCCSNLVHRNLKVKNKELRFRFARIARSHDAAALRTRSHRARFGCGSTASSCVQT